MSFSISSWSWQARETSESDEEPHWPDIMDPNAWQAYHQAAAAYSNRLNGGGGGQDDHHPPYHNPLSLLASASHHYQHNILPPSLLAAQHNKSSLLTPPVTPGSSWDSAVAQRRSVIEASQAKASQPAFPGQPPPLQDARRIEASSPAFPGQPPPRQSSQPRSQIFPGSNHSNHYSQQQHSPGYGNNYSPGAPSPQAYSNVQSPQDYHSSHSSHSSQRRDREDRDRHQRDRERARLEQEMRERQKEKERLERQRIAEERREQERIRQEQEFRREQERIRQEKEREEKARREREKAEQEERRRREREKIDLERRKREEEESRRKEEERRREVERLDQQRKEQDERDLGLARLSAMGTLNDLGEENDNYQQHYEQEHSNNFNINMFNQYQHNMIKQEHHEQKPLVNQFNNWINRASELLDLSSSDSRDNSGQTDEQSSNFIPQILMNPWDPQQAPMMSLAPIANAMQHYQQQWLTQYQQAAGMLNQEEGSFPLGKFRVLCISPDEDMGFLINLPPPCNLLFQQEALVQKCVDSPFILVFQNFLKDPALSSLRKNLCEAPDRPPPFIEQEEKLKGDMKKEYVPPYTPRATQDPESKAKLSSSGYSRSLEITPVRRSAASRHQRTASQSQVRTTSGHTSASNTAHRAKQAKRNVSEDEEDELPEIRK